MGSDYRRKDSSRHNECDSTYYSEDSWEECDDKFSTSYDKKNAERSRYWRDYERSSETRKHNSPRPRRRSRSRSRDELAFRSKRLRYDDDHPTESSRHRHRLEVEPSQTIIVKGLAPKYDDGAVWSAITEQGFQPKDVRILKRRDTGGVIFFVGYLVIDNHRVAEMEYSANRSSHGSTSFTGNMQRGGDWICGKCSTNNFKKRDYCFKCGVRREDSDSVCGDGFSEIGVLPSDSKYFSLSLSLNVCLVISFYYIFSLLFRNLPYQIDEAKILSTLMQSCSVDVCQIFIARNPETGLSRGYAYVQLNSVTDAAQLLTNLTAVTKLIIEGREVLVSYSKIPLTTVIARAALSQNVDISAKYYYNPLSQQFVYWEPSYQTYLPALTQVQQQNQASCSPGGRVGETEEKPKKQPKDKHDKVKMAKKIQKDMEKWARQLNQRKEGISTRHVLRQQSTVQEQSPSTSGSADAAFVVLGRSVVDPDISAPSLVEQQDSDEERPKASYTTISLLEEQLVDWEKLTCLLCRRQFQSKDTLLKHQQFSELHKKNLQRKQGETVDSSVASAMTSSYSGRYRDRAKERREKFGLDDQIEPNALKEKFLVESVSEEPVSSPMQTDNKGAKLMRSMGWQEGQGLGRQNQGITDPITEWVLNNNMILLQAERRIAGVGLGASGAVRSSFVGASYKEHVKAALRQKFETM
ncbi:RNA-binding protein 5 [Trichuris trichiura]|uniref:RNA-binding protein 5 n=1 Tax=Trichuris trichiura TaxID=36087 RepID=A0A077ZD15_TRITR|nr:RNA-binding protein 5 [Trichuris trichiura]